jgi:hypothetical protein
MEFTKSYNHYLNISERPSYTILNSYSALIIFLLNARVTRQFLLKSAPHYSFPKWRNLTNSLVNIVVPCGLLPCRPDGRLAGWLAGWRTCCCRLEKMSNRFVLSSALSPAQAATAAGKKPKEEKELSKFFYVGEDLATASVCYLRHRPSSSSSATKAAGENRTNYMSRCLDK